MLKKSRIAALILVIAMVTTLCVSTAYAGFDPGSIVVEEVWTNVDARGNISQAYQLGAIYGGPSGEQVVNTNFYLRVVQNAAGSVCGYIAADATSGEYNALFAALQLAPDGMFKCRNGGGYENINKVSYEVGDWFYVEFEINLTGGTYNVWVTPHDGDRVQITADYAFRSDAMGSPKTAGFNRFACYRGDNPGEARGANLYEVINHNPRLIPNPIKFSRIEIPQGANSLINVKLGTEFSVIKGLPSTLMGYGKEIIDGVEADEETTRELKVGTDYEWVGTTYDPNTVGAQKITINIISTDEKMDFSEATKPEFTINVVPETSIIPIERVNQGGAAANGIAISGEQYVGSVTAKFKLNYNASTPDSIIGFSGQEVDADEYGELTAILRVSSSLQPGFAAYNMATAGYAAVNQLAPEVGKTYDVEFKIDLVNKKYSVWVTPEGGEPVLIADKYAIRKDTNNIYYINVWAGNGQIGGAFIVTDVSAQSGLVEYTYPVTVSDGIVVADETSATFMAYTTSTEAYTDAIAVVMFYDTAGNLKHTKIEKKSIPKTEFNSDFGPFEFPPECANGTYKVIILKDYTSLSPLCTVYKYKAE